MSLIFQETLENKPYLILNISSDPLIRYQIVATPVHQFPARGPSRSRDGGIAGPQCCKKEQGLPPEPLVWDPGLEAPPRSVMTLASPARRRPLPGEACPVAAGRRQPAPRGQCGRAHARPSSRRPTATVVDPTGCFRVSDLG